MTASGYHTMCEVARLKIGLGLTMKEIAPLVAKGEKATQWYWAQAKEMIRHPEISRGSNLAGVAPASTRRLTRPRPNKVSGTE